MQSFTKDSIMGALFALNDKPAASASKDQLIERLKSIVCHGHVGKQVTKSSAGKKGVQANKLTEKILKFFTNFDKETLDEVEIAIGNDLTHDFVFDKNKPYVVYNGPTFENEKFELTANGIQSFLDKMASLCKKKVRFVTVRVYSTPYEKGPTPKSIRDTFGQFFIKECGIKENDPHFELFKIVVDKKGNQKFSKVKP